ncbi:MAG TPA: PDZ domain-containing protein [Candidatus Binatia bacterium]|nr:PDZ domain-containing protein [Candidatus Binatia bacterium]
MAGARGVIVVIGLLAAAAAGAAGPCEEERATTGLAVGNHEGVLAVEAVDAGLAAARAGVQTGDVLVQANATQPHACADWARALREARRDHAAVLLLVRRGEQEVPLALAAATWGAAVAAVPPPSPPSPAVSPPPPPPLPPEVPVALPDVLARLEALAPAERPPASLDAYAADLRRLHQEVETLAARNAVPGDAADGLRRVLHLFDGAEVAWRAIEAEREATRRPRHIPMPDEATAPYFAESAAGTALEEFPFLKGTIVREPSAGRLVESSGLWRPIEARGILWAHGREALARLEGKLGR